jgi:Fe2+ or Zn2+ uptake regulation protein
MKEILDVEQVLISKGVKPTPQRMVIADFLMHTHSHPTADEVLTAVENRLPCALSRATVYNTLNSLVAAGVVQEVVTEAGKTRYDANVSDHHHFVDVKTGRIFDIPGDLVPKLSEKLGEKYKVHNYQITFYGEMESSE